MKNSIVVNQLVKTFHKGKTVAVDDISFQVEGGEIYGLLGANGAGKTTTLRMLGTLLKPDSGNIYIKGYDLQKHIRRARMDTGFLSSSLHLEDNFTPDYLFDFFSGIYGIHPSDSQKRKKELFDLFEIEGFAKKPLAKLSDGMKQKVSLAVSVVQDPSVIIFDEPTNGLDIIASRIVTDFLLQQKALGKCIVISTHIFELVEKICDRVGIMIKGQMVLSGELSQVKNGKTLEDRFFEVHREKENYGNWHCNNIQ